MSAAAAESVDPNGGDAPASARAGKKKLIVLLAAALLMAGAGGGGFMLWKKRQAAAQAAEAAENGEAEDADAAADAKKGHEAKGPPAFLPLDAFVVNLADRDAERYAQVGVTLQVDDAKVAEELKLYMPAIRNGVLMILAHKTAAELLEREGKERLAAEIMREAVRPLGIELPPPAAASAPAVKRKKSDEPEVHNPVEHVHFSSFIIQ